MPNRRTGGRGAQRRGFFFAAPAGRHGGRFSSKPRELSAPGPRTYFCHAAKVGKSALKPCGLRIPHFLISLRPRHSRFGLPLVPSASFPFCAYFSILVGGPYRIAGLTLRGARLKNCPLGRIPFAGGTALKGRQPEFYKCQSTRSDARRTCSSCDTATLHFIPMSANPSPRSRRIGGTEKGFLNRRFKPAFAYFSRARKVGAKSGAA